MISPFSLGPPVPHSVSKIASRVTPPSLIGLFKSTTLLSRSSTVPVVALRDYLVYLSRFRTFIFVLSTVKSRQFRPLRTFI